METKNNWLARINPVLNRIHCINLGLFLIAVGVYLALAGTGGIKIISTLPFTLGFYLIWSGGVKGKIHIFSNFGALFFLIVGIGIWVLFVFIINAMTCFLCR